MRRAGPGQVMSVSGGTCSGPMQWLQRSSADPMSARDGRPAASAGAAQAAKSSIGKAARIAAS